MNDVPCDVTKFFAGDDTTATSEKNKMGISIVIFFTVCPFHFKDALRPLHNVPFYPISASGSNFNPRNILYIPVVKIFTFLELEQN